MVFKMLAVGHKISISELKIEILPMHQSQYKFNIQIDNIPLSKFLLLNLQS